MASRRELTPTERRWMAALFVAFGMFMLAMAFGIVKPRPGSVHAPLWVLASVGMVFNLGGVLVFLVGREGVDSLRNMVVWCFVLALAIPFNWIAFGEGERHFSGSVSGFGVSQINALGEATGRWVFGGFALLMDFILIASLIRYLRGKPAFDPQDGA